MAWVKIDDQAPRNHKLLKAGPAAAWMWVCCIAHCQAHATGGFVEDIAIPMVGIRGAERARRLADVLVDCGLLDRISNVNPSYSDRIPDVNRSHSDLIPIVKRSGFMVHDYLEFNESREEALKRRAELAEKRAKAGKAGGLAKVANAKQTVFDNSSPDPTRPDLTKNPLTPFQGGRRQKRKDGVRGSVCAHEPQCETFTACRDRILHEARTA